MVRTMRTLWNLADTSTTEKVALAPRATAGERQLSDRPDFGNSRPRSRLGFVKIGTTRGGSIGCWRKVPAQQTPVVGELQERGNLTLAQKQEVRARIEAVQDEVHDSWQRYYKAKQATQAKRRAAIRAGATVQPERRVKPEDRC